MHSKSFLFLFIGSSVLLNANPISEYFEGTVSIVTSSGANAPEGFFNAPVGSTVIGSFTFDPSIDAPWADNRPLQNGVGSFTYYGPATLALQDASGSFAVTDQGLNVNLYRGYPSSTAGNDEVQLVVGSSDGAYDDQSAMLGIVLPPGANGDMTLSEFPWGVQPLSSCYESTGVNTCSGGQAQYVLADGSTSILQYSIDKVGLTPFTLAPEPSSISICALGLVGVIAGLAIPALRASRIDPMLALRSN